MRRAFLLVLFFTFVALAPAWGQQENTSPTKVDARVDSLLKQMTLEEKISLIERGEIHFWFARDTVRWISVGDKHITH